MAFYLRGIETIVDRMLRRFSHAACACQRVVGKRVASVATGERNPRAPSNRNTQRVQGRDNKWVMLCFDWITRVDEHRETRVMGFQFVLFSSLSFSTPLFSPFDASQPSSASGLTAPRSVYICMYVVRARSSMIFRGNNLSFPFPARFLQARVIMHATTSNRLSIARHRCVHSMGCWASAGQCTDEHKKTGEMLFLDWYYVSINLVY